MIVKMEVEYYPREVEDIVKAEYLRKFGPPAEGFELVATSSYGHVTVTTVPVRKPVEPAMEEAEMPVAAGPA